jgi:serine/threonine protein kinase
MLLDQPNVVKLYSVFHDTDHIYLLMELCTDGDLRSEAKKLKNPKEIKKFILGIAYGLRHLHRRNIRHGDIKLENVICSYVIIILFLGNGKNSRFRLYILWQI